MFWSIPCFQNSRYLDSPALMNYFFSTDLNTSSPQIGQYGTRFGTLVGSFGDPSKFDFHNSTRGSSVGLQTLYVGETLYYMIGQPNESTKNLNKCISMCLTKVSRPFFKQHTTQVLKFGSLGSIAKWRVVLMKPWKPSSNLPKYNCFSFSNFLKITQSTCQYLHMYDQLQEIWTSPP